MEASSLKFNMNIASFNHMQCYGEKGPLDYCPFFSSQRKKNEGFLKSLLNYVPYLFSCRRCLVIFVLLCLRYLVPYVLSCLTCSRASCVLCLTCSCASRVSCSTCSCTSHDSCSTFPLASRFSCPTCFLTSLAFYTRCSCAPCASVTLSVSFSTCSHASLVLQLS